MYGHITLPLATIDQYNRATEATMNGRSYHAAGGGSRQRYAANEVSTGDDADILAVIIEEATAWRSVLSSLPAVDAAELVRLSSVGR